MEKLLVAVGKFKVSGFELLHSSEASLCSSRNPLWSLRLKIKDHVFCIDNTISNDF